MGNVFSDSDDAFETIEILAEKMMLSCPEYHSFKDLATKMVDAVPSGAVKILVIEEGMDNIYNKLHCSFTG